MSQRAVQRFITTIVLCMAGAMQASGGPVREGDTLRVVIVGSSTAQGMGASIADSAWANRYARYLAGIDPRFFVTNLARAGYTTYQCLPNGAAHPRVRPAPDTLRNITRALALSPAAVIVTLPSNDVAAGYSEEEQIANFERIAGEAERRGVPVWVSTTQPRTLDTVVNAKLLRMRDWLADRFEPRTLDFWTGLADSAARIVPDCFAPDGVHPNDRGHRLLFDRVAGADIALYLLSTASASPPVPSMSTAVAVYPNPARERIAARFTGAQPSKAILVISDIMGREVERLEPVDIRSGTNTIQVDTRRLRPGMYVLLLHAGDRISIGKLIKTAS